MAFATDLVDCGRRRLGTERMAAYWRWVLPDMVRDLYYEELVEDLERQARRLVDFIGLGWDPACLSFYETERAVNTPSAWQVRQPIYKQDFFGWYIDQQVAASAPSPPLGAERVGVRWGIPERSARAYLTLPALRAGPLPLRPEGRRGKRVPARATLLMSSVGRWRNDERHLGPLLAVLGEPGGAAGGVLSKEA